MEALIPTPSVSFIIKEAVTQYLNSRRRTIRKLAGVKLSEPFAQAVWERINDHKWYLSERLGRDVGLRVAAIDYFENIEPPIKPASFIRHRDSIPPKLPMMMPLSSRL
jgi:hypothetical protein